MSVLLSPWPPSVDITRELGFDFDLLLTGGYSYVNGISLYLLHHCIYIIL